ncbi:MAG: arylamine N-acetyltransferase [Gemmatimonadaceae bacterium]|nr:arylamine N-acetyltransferase [Gemmatimonadaceae bacterium]
MTTGARALDTPGPPALEPDQLERYLARIGYAGSRAPTLETLRALHRAHLLTIPYENLDIHLGRSLTVDPRVNVGKLCGTRGGWCYEMNGVFGAVLRTLGFDVHLLSGAVGREHRGDAAEANHLVLRVNLGQPWIADVGFGDAFLEPLPLAPGTYRQDFLVYRVALDGERWTVFNHEHGGADAFDFTLAPRTLGHFAAKCLDLSTSADSVFVQHLVLQRFVSAGLVTLRGAVLRHVRASGVDERTIENGDAWARAVEEEFGVVVPGVEALWDGVRARHLAWLASRQSLPDDAPARPSSA